MENIVVSCVACAKSITHLCRDHEILARKARERVARREHAVSLRRYNENLAAFAAEVAEDRAAGEEVNF